MVSIVDEMQENRLRWLGHVLRRKKTVRLAKEMYAEEEEKDN